MTPNHLIILCIIFSQITTLMGRPALKRAPAQNQPKPGIADTLLAAAFATIFCFPSTARVSLENGQSQTMSHLQIGDRVQTVSPDGIISYSEVASFLDKRPDATVNMYNSITTSGNQTITLSGKHLIYARRFWNDKFKPIYADQILIQDEVLANVNHEFTPVKVMNISKIIMQGAFSPLTIEGKIIVDGIVASCYAEFPDPDMAHIGMTPMRILPEVVQWIFGKDHDLPIYTKIHGDVGRWVLPSVLLNDRC